MAGYKDYEQHRIGGSRETGFGHGELFPRADSHLKGAAVCNGFVVDWIRRLMWRDEQGVPSLLHEGWMWFERRNSVFYGVEPNKFTRRLDKILALQKVLDDESDVRGLVGKARKFKISIPGDYLADLETRLPKAEDHPHVESMVAAKLTRAEFAAFARYVDGMSAVEEGNLYSFPEGNRLKRLFELQKKADGRTRRRNLNGLGIDASNVPYESSSVISGHLFWSEVVAKFLSRPTVGRAIQIQLRSDHYSHAVGLYRHSKDISYFFDPNFGEYRFNNPFSLRNFIVAMWEQEYRKEVPYRWAGYVEYRLEGGPLP
jgi:hypothetical protein